ncbi:hypothetical protein D041_5020A, partial [Vibrio parahaemolyticus EKP-008]
MEPYGKYWV